MRSTRGMLRALVPALLVLLCAATQLAAQRWQQVIGGNKAPGEEGNAVIETANGNIVAAGVSNSAKGSPLAYVVRTDPHGTVLWQYTYDINANAVSFANDIREYPNGDLIVVGSTNNAGTPNAFAMRLDPSGTVLWCTTLTTGGTISEATGVVVAKQGNGTTTFPDDIILCGRQSNTGGASYEAMLVRLDASGNWVWAQSYDFSAISGGAFAQLYSVDETQTTTVNGVPGEVIATGSCDDLPLGFAADVLYMRADGNTGTINAPPHGVALFGGFANDIGYSLVELRNGAHPGDVAITGASESRPAPSGTTEVFVVQAYDDPCDPNGLRAATYSGDDGPLRDWGLCVREITTPTLGNVGDVMISGGTESGNYTPSEDAFMQSFKEGSMTQAAARSEYGGVGTETARSLTPVIAAPTTPGFAFTGSSTTPWPFTPGNTHDLYLVKSDFAGAVPCSTSTRTTSDLAAGWSPACVTPKTNVIPAANFLTSVITYQATMFWPTYVICYTPFKPVAPEHASPDIIAGENELLARPNPVRRGMPLAIDVRSAENTTALITVSDALGREVQRNHTPVTAGTATISIPTAGWPLGTYTVAIACNGSLRTARVVVIDR